jgi:hypothetical protein
MAVTGPVPETFSALPAPSARVRSWFPTRCSTFLPLLPSFFPFFPFFPFFAFFAFFSSLRSPFFSPRAVARALLARG